MTEISGGIDYSILRSIHPIETIVNYGYGYRCFPHTSLTGRTVFTVAPGTTEVHPLFKVFEIEDFTVPVEIGNLFALDARNLRGGPPFITTKGSILIPSSLTGQAWSALYRYSNGRWTKVFVEDTTESVIYHLCQDKATHAIYMCDYQPATFRGMLWKSDDDGVSWHLVYDVTEASAADAIIYDVAANADCIIATKRNKKTYIRSFDGGATWFESAVLPTALRSVVMHPNLLNLTFISSDACIYYSRDYFVTYNRMRIHGAPGVLRYPIRVGGKLLMSAVAASRTTILASKDLYHTATPIFSAEALTSRMSGYGDYVFVGADFAGTLTRILLPKTLERGFSNSVLLWEDEAVLVAGAETDLIETGFNDKKTFSLWSNQSGTLHIQVYDEIAAIYRDVDSIPVSANTLALYIPNFETRLIRCRFVPDADAIVSAWVVFE